MYIKYENFSEDAVDLKNKIYNDNIGILIIGAAI